MKLLRKNVTVPYLPETTKPYTLALDLDETLVHLVESEGEDGSYCYFRPGVNVFLKEVSKYFEIVIFTAAMPDVSSFLRPYSCPNVFSVSMLIQSWTHSTSRRSGLLTGSIGSTHRPEDNSQCKLTTLFLISDTLTARTSTYWGDRWSEP